LQAGVTECGVGAGCMADTGGMPGAVGMWGADSLGGVVLPPQKAGDPHGSMLLGPWGHQGAT